MSQEIKLEAESRSEFGKGAARRARRAGRVPAVMYGHGTDPVHITLPAHDTLLALRTANALLTIVIDGGQGQLALPKQVQRDPIRGSLSHIDLVVVRKGEKVTVDVQVHVEGDAAPDTIVTVESQTIELLVEATNIPANVVVNVEGLEAGSQIHAGAIELPAGAELASDPDTLVVNVSATMSQAELDAELGEGEAVEEAPLIEAE